MDSYRRLYYSIISLFLVVGLCTTLENGLARTPPMGWLSWSVFWCEIDCEKNPQTCVSEKQIMEMTDKMVQDGYKEVGYDFVAVDDCWLEKERDHQGKLQADHKRFSKGIKWLADYVHNKGLKFGIYEDIGVKTCAGYPGSYNHEEIDAQTFASWGVDYVKLDGCYVNGTDMGKGYQAFRDALNKTKRNIVYSCEWPVYVQEYEQKKPNYTAVKETCNLWRNWNDVALSWESVLSIIDYFNQNEEEFVKASGPGGWNDPDMIIAGNDDALTLDQAKVQMAMWSIWSAPLIISVDLRTIKEPFKKIIQNKDVIAIDQDPLGVMGKVVLKVGDTSVYVKPITPVDEKTGDHSYAIAFFNRGPKQDTLIVSDLQSLGLTHAGGYELKNLFDPEASRMIKPNHTLEVTVSPTGVTMYKATIAMTEL